MSYKGKYPCTGCGDRIEAVGKPRHMCWECYRKALDDELAEIQRHNERQAFKPDLEARKNETTIQRKVKN